MENANVADYQIPDELQYTQEDEWVHGVMAGLFAMFGLGLIRSAFSR